MTNCERVTDPGICNVIYVSTNPSLGKFSSKSTSRVLILIGFMEIASSRVLGTFCLVILIVHEEKRVHKNTQIE